MSYVTQGTIQVQLNAASGTRDKSDIGITINPLQNYSVKHNSKIFVVFIDEKPLRSKVFEKGETFHYRSNFAQHLIDIAAKEIKVEIQINGSREIESIKIPATSTPL